MQGLISFLLIMTIQLSIWEVHNTYPILQMKKAETQTGKETRGVRLCE